MLGELQIKTAMVEQLKGDFQDYSIKDFPVNQSDYVPHHPNGELLIKSQGYRITRVLNRDNSMDLLNMGSISIMGNQWRIDLICKQHRTQDEIFALTERIITSMRLVDIDNYNAGRFYITDVGEPGYDEGKRFQYRTLIFTVPFLFNIDEE